MKGRYFVNEVVLKESGDGKWKLQIKDAEWLDLTTAEVRGLFFDAAQTHSELYHDLVKGEKGNVRFTYDLEGVPLHCFGTYDEGEDATREYPGYPPSFSVDEVHVNEGQIPFDVLYLLDDAGDPIPLEDVLQEAGMEQAMIDLEKQE